MEAFATLSDGLRLRFVTSVVATFVMNSDDVENAFVRVGAESYAAIERALDQERSRGGSA